MVDAAAGITAPSTAPPAAFVARSVKLEASELAA